MSKQVTTIVAALLLAAGVGGAVGAGVALQTDSNSSASGETTTVQNESVSQTATSAALVYQRY
jgi:hypothetical protein